MAITSQLAQLSTKMSSHCFCCSFSLFLRFSATMSHFETIIYSFFRFNASLVVFFLYFCTLENNHKI